MSPAAPFADFVAAAEAVAASRRRLDKAATLAAYFRDLDDASLRLAVRYAAGQPFPAWDRRAIQVGTATWLRALAARSGVEVAALKAALVVAGDLGDVAAQVLPQADARLLMADVAQHLDALAAAPAGAGKAAPLAALLAAAAPAEARYLVKLVACELRIGLREGAVEDALARMAAVDVDAIGAANMRLGDLGETAVLARHGQLGTVTHHLYHPLKFMLATAAPDVADIVRQMPADFIAQDKFDGIRCQAHLGPAAAAPASAHGEVVDGVRVALFSRALGNLTATFPDLLAPLARAATADGGVILDGELVAVDGEGVRPFAALQRRLGRKRLTDADLAATPVALVAFDLLYVDGALTLAQPLSARRARLEALVAAAGEPALRAAATVHVADAAAIEPLFAAARARGHEGLVLKDPGSPYRPGRRGRDWLKLKRAQATLDVVITAAEVGHGRRARWLSDFTFAVRRSAADPTLVEVGKAYSGLTEAELTELTELLGRLTLEVGAHGKWRRVAPTVVLEVTFDQAQASSRWPSGFALRFPRILRWRRDLAVADVDTVADVAALVAPPTG